MTSVIFHEMHMDSMRKVMRHVKAKGQSVDTVWVGDSNYLREVLVVASATQGRIVDARYGRIIVFEYLLNGVIVTRKIFSVDAEDRILECLETETAQITGLDKLGE